jgi:hypothetical protein
LVAKKIQLKSNNNNFEVSLVYILREIKANLKLKDIENNNKIDLKHLLLIEEVFFD